MTAEDITRAQRESVYSEGERAFEAGQRRGDNPYGASNPTLEQVWWNGWDHSRRRKQRERSAYGTIFGVKTSERLTPAKKDSVYAEGMQAFQPRQDDTPA